MRADNVLHRCTAVMVLHRTTGSLLIHQRSQDKDIWPLWWDLASGGVVEAGENLEEAAERELSEELGVTASLTKLGSARFTGDDVDVFMPVWVATHPGPFVFTDGEIEQTAWVSAAELRHQLSVENFCLDSVSVALPLLAKYSSDWNVAIQLS